MKGVLARGGMGVVYEAHQASLGTRVALKVVDAARLHASHARERFQREARAAARVRHPHVVRMLASELESEPPFIVMELLEGETLQVTLQREGRLSLERALDWSLPILSAVAAIHDAGILHRDLKTGNVMLAQEGGGVRPVVLDFGIARLAEDDGDATLTHSEALLGTPRYLSPEQMLNAKAASARSDQYALGIMLYECLTGVRPFSGGSHYELMHAVLNAAVRAPSAQVSDLPPGLDEVILRAMNRDALARFEDVRAFGRALLAFAEASTAERWRQDFAADARATEGEDRTEVDRRTSLRARATAISPVEARRAKQRPRLYLIALSVALVVTTVAARRAELGDARRSPETPARVLQQRAGAGKERAAVRREDTGARKEQGDVRKEPALAPAAGVAAASASSEQRAPGNNARRPGRRRAPAAASSALPSRNVPARAAARSAGEPRDARLEELGKDDAVDPFVATAP